MDVRWRERDWEPLREEVAEARPTVRATLAASGLLKFLSAHCYGPISTCSTF
jgi:hypothetical protein